MASGSKPEAGSYSIILISWTNRRPCISPITSYDALPPWGRRLWDAARFLVPTRPRLFFEGNRLVRGQLWYAERKALFDAIRQRRPKTVFEVGTWQGGGSTFFIAEALYRNGQGTLFTSEIDRSRYEQAVASYEAHLPHLLPHVRFHHGASLDVYPKVLSEAGSVDAVLLDGEQDAAKTVQEFGMFEPFMSPGSILLMHDWDNEKMRLLKARLGSSDAWTPELIHSARGSVGFAVFSRSGP